MKKILLIFIGFAMLLSLVQCSTVLSLTGSFFNPKVIACKSTCDLVYDRCVTNAKKNKSKMATCKTTRDTAYTVCENRFR